MMKTVWVVCGNKGGVGKSLLCLALISCLIRLSRQLAVLDGDGRSPDVFKACKGKLPARAVDFRKLRPDRYDDMHDGEYEMLIQKLLAISTDLVINTPDGTDDVLMQWFDATLRFTENAHCTFRMLYVVNHRSDGLELLPEMSKRFAYLFPIRNLYFARAPAFTEFNGQYSRLFQETFDFPVLRSIEVTRLLEKHYLPSEYVDSQAGMLLSRQRVSDWLAEMDSLFYTLTHSDVANTLPITS
ncbi:nucleotide-binding protein [Glaciimonas sp. GG7]